MCSVHFYMISHYFTFFSRIKGKIKIWTDILSVLIYHVTSFWWWWNILFDKTNLSIGWILWIQAGCHSEKYLFDKYKISILKQPSLDECFWRVLNKSWTNWAHSLPDFAGLILSSGRHQHCRCPCPSLLSRTTLQLLGDE